MTYRAAQNLIKRGDEPALRQALDTGLDANLANQNGWTLLMLTAAGGALTIGHLLIKMSHHQHPEQPALAVQIVILFIRYKDDEGRTLRIETTHLTSR